MAQIHKSRCLHVWNFPALQAAQNNEENKSAGFTLVELAIVLMIIGLLIGGILRGQELLKNTKVTATIEQFKSFDAATVSFLDQYHNLPGDMVSPVAHIPNCSTAPCNTPGNGDGQIGPVATSTSFDYSAATENNVYFIQLAASHLLSGIDQKSDWATGAQHATYPPVPAGGVWWIAFYNHAQGGPIWQNGISGHWLDIVGQDKQSGILTNNGLPASMMIQIDKKIDDGLPLSGNVLINNGACVPATNAYDPNNAQLCNLMIKSSF